MTADIQLHVIARIHSDFPTKFGIPRQSGIVPALKSQIVFEPAYRNPDAVRGLEGYSHIWLIWEFSENIRENWSATVRPPRLGSNTRVGVFASRSPFRPNPLGLSSVRLEKIELTLDRGPVLYVAGADLMDGTPLFDIKPYLPHNDCHPEATGGFAAKVRDYAVEVSCPEPLLAKLPAEKRQALLEVLRQDPRPGYQDDPERVYGVAFAGFDIKFQVAGGLLTVCAVEPLHSAG